MFKFLNGPNQEQSSKRLFTLVLMILWVIYFFSNLYGGYVLRETFEDQLFYMILVFYVGIAIESWKEVFKSTPKPPTITKIENIEKAENVGGKQ